jgi:hypothetical protein
MAPVDPDEPVAPVAPGVGDVVDDEPVQEATRIAAAMPRTTLRFPITVRLIPPPY